MCLRYLGTAVDQIIPADLGLQRACTLWAFQLYVVVCSQLYVVVCCLQEAKPSYRELEAVLKGIQGSGSSQTWAQRLRSEFAFNKESLNRKK